MANFPHSDSGSDQATVRFRRTATGGECVVDIATTRGFITQPLTGAQVTAALAAAGVTAAELRALLLGLFNAAVTAAGGV